MRTLLSLLVVALMLGLGSCKKDKDPVGCSAAWATEVQDELTAYINALEAYMDDPTSETCNAYKEAGLDYIDALEPFVTCAALTAEEQQLVQESIEQSQAELDELNCETK